MHAALTSLCALPSASSAPAYPEHREAFERYGGVKDVYQPNDFYTRYGRVTITLIGPDQRETSVRCRNMLPSPQETRRKVQASVSSRKQAELKQVKRASKQASKQASSKQASWQAQQSWRDICERWQDSARPLPRPVERLSGVKMVK